MILICDRSRKPQSWPKSTVILHLDLDVVSIAEGHSSGSQTKLTTALQNSDPASMSIRMGGGGFFSALISDRSPGQSVGSVPPFCSVCIAGKVRETGPSFRRWCEK